MTLKRKILVLISLLTCAIILAMSMTYYVLLTRQVKAHSQGQVTSAFNLIFADLHTTIEDTISRMNRGLLPSLSGPLYVVQLLQEQFKEAGQKEWGVREVRKVISQLSALVYELQRFAERHSAKRVLIYDHDKQLLALALTQNNETVLGLHLPGIFPEELILMRPGDDWYALLTDLQEIPRQPMPEEIPVTYQGAVPETPAASFSVAETLMMLTFRARIQQGDGIGGILVIDVPIQQHDVVQYARLSNTQVNIFSGASFSVGTFPEYASLPESAVTSPHAVDLNNLPETFPLEFSELEYEHQDFYQGTLTLGDEETLLGAITVHVSREAEEQQLHEFVLIVIGISCVFAILTAAGASVLSGIIVKPIVHLTQLLEKLTRGNLIGIEEDIAAIHTPSFGTKDELSQLFSSFQAMLHYLRDMATLAEHISQGDISYEIAPRSSHDSLGHAFHRMMSYLKDIGEVARNVAQGNLRNPITRSSSADQLAQAFLHMQEGLIALIAQIRADTDHTASISTQILSTATQNSEALSHIGNTAEITSSAMQQVNASAEEVRLNTAHLTSSVEETSASISQMVTSIKQVAGNTRKLSHFAEETTTIVVDIVNSLEKVAEQAEQSKNLSEATSEDAGSGQESVNRMIASITTISEVTENLSHIISRLETRSTEIGTILDVINEVAEQTSLLSLNASIIAAQAGEHGRGFAVVASEIKDLATRVRTSTKEIVSIVQAVQYDSADAVHVIEQGQEEVQHGVTVAQHAGEALEKIRRSAGNSATMAAEMTEAVRQQTTAHTRIVDSIRGVSNMINEITQATQEQENNSTQLFAVVENMQTLAAQVLRATQEQQESTQHVTNFMEEVIALVEENAPTVQQLAKSAQELSSQAESLKTQVTRFRLPE